MLRQTILKEESTRIPTRFIASKQPKEDPLDRTLQVDIESAKKDPRTFKHNVGLLKSYAALPPTKKRGTDERVANNFAEHVKGNLLWLHDKMPEEQRERARKWYDGANRIANERADQYGLSTPTVAAVYAALSPQKTWHENCSCGDRVLSAYLTKQGQTWTPDMEAHAQRIWSSDKNLPIYEAIRGKRLADLTAIDHKAAWIRTYDEAHNSKNYQMVEPEGRLGRIYTNRDAYGPEAKSAGTDALLRWGSIAEIAKAIGCIESQGDIDTISLLMGQRHKVRSFYNNIADPNGDHGDVTIDTHAVAASLLHPLGGNTTEVAHNFKNTLPANTPGADTFIPAKGSIITGVKGTYPFYADGYRRAAAERGILPREMQSITWEAAKGLFNGNGNGKAKFLPQIKALWGQYQSGNMSVDEVRERIHDLSGGMQAPDWAKKDSDEQL